MASLFNYNMLLGSDKFEINSDGEILTITALDYETDTVYSLTVTATDKGTPIKSVSENNRSV